MTDNFDLIKDTPWDKLSAIPAIFAEYERQINELEEEKAVMAEQIKQREGFWLDAPDSEMIKIGMSWLKQWTHMNNTTREYHLEEAYKAMCDSWLSRQS